MTTTIPTTHTKMASLSFAATLLLLVTVFVANEAIEVVSSRTIGAQGEFSNQKDPENPHRGRTAAQRAANTATGTLIDGYISKNAISETNPMTRTQAHQVIGQINSSEVPAIRSYLDSLRSYARDVVRQNPLRFINRGGGRGGSP